jgi:outer membrane lipoprotein-sorting protein
MSKHARAGRAVAAPGILSLAALACVAGAAMRLAAGADAAETEAARRVLERVEARLRGLGSLRGRFVMSFTSSGLGVPQTERGRFAIRRPDRMRWDYTDPERKIAVSDGMHTWLYLPEDHLVYPTPEAAPGAGTWCSCCARGGRGTI